MADRCGNRSVMPRSADFTFATVITLLLVPVFYSYFILDLKIVKWEPGKHCSWSGNVR
jgi:hypothetical protein